MTSRQATPLDTTRAYPRTVRQAFPIDYRESAIGIDGPPVIRGRAPWWVRVVTKLQRKSAK